MHMQPLTVQYNFEHWIAPALENMHSYRVHETPVSDILASGWISDESY